MNIEVSTIFGQDRDMEAYVLCKMSDALDAVLGIVPQCSTSCWPMLD